MVLRLCDSDLNLIIVSQLEPRRANALVICHEFSCRDNAIAWRKSTKEADKDKKNSLQFRK